MSNITKRAAEGTGSSKVANAKSRAGDDEAMRQAKMRAKRDKLMEDRRKRDALDRPEPKRSNSNKAGPGIRTKQTARKSRS